MKNLEKKVSRGFANHRLYRVIWKYLLSDIEVAFANL
jgi:hypothetical protein